MEFNKVFEEYLELYTEAKEAPKGKHYDSAGRLRSGDADADGRGGPKYRSDPTYVNPNEDGEINDYTEDQISQFAAIDKELADGKSLKDVIESHGSAIIKAYVEYMTEGEEVEDCESCGCSDEEVEDCETCGCKENPEYGHFNDTYSSYIDQYEEDAEDGETFETYLKDIFAQQYDSDPEQFENFIDDIHDALGQQKEYDLGKGSGLTEPLEWRMEMGMDLDTAIEDAQASLASLTVSDVVTAEEDAEKIDKDRMKCNKPRRTSGGSKKFVVKACKDGKEKIVRFGDPNMKIKKSNPKRRKSFRARHKCDQKKDKFSAGYWSCKKW